MKNYRAQSDMIYLIGMLFMVVIAIFVVDIIYTQFVHSPQFQQVANATPTGQLAVQKSGQAINILNDAVAFLFIFGAVGSIIAAIFTTSDTAFAVIGVILMPIEILFAFIFHDIFFTVMQNSFFAGLLTTYPYTTYIFQYLPVVTFILSIIMLAVTFIKP